MYPLEILTFEDLNMKWKNKLPKKDKIFNFAGQPSKNLPDSGSTIDPTQPCSPDIKLRDLDIKSIISVSDDDDEQEYRPKTDRPKIKLQQSIVVLNFFKL